MADSDTIVAQATPTGFGGIGVVRISGAKSLAIAQRLTQRQDIIPRHAYYNAFYANDVVIDQGVLLYFKAPHSFTGEDVVELQGHGGPVVMQQIIQAALFSGARIARPGEFSERAFLNGKLDLAQAEAIADLIYADTEQAACSAVRSLQGEFSATIHAVLEQLIQLRMYVEAAIDFPEEEIDFLADQSISEQLQALIEQVTQVLKTARQGQLLKEGMTLVIAGRPNAGKSSLLNALAGTPSAIVTEVAGTTRDILKESIQIEGVPLHIVDTAGLRDTDDVVEREGVKRARAALQQADQVLLVVDQQDWNQVIDIVAQALPNWQDIPVTILVNKVDMALPSLPKRWQDYPVIALSAKTGLGLDQLRQHLLQSMDYQQTNEGQFIARARHVNALQRTQAALLQGQQQLQAYRAGEILAEELRQAQRALGEITGEFTADDLLGEIFASFCIGK